MSAGMRSVVSRSATEDGRRTASTRANQSETQCCLPNRSSHLEDALPRQTVLSPIAGTRVGAHLGRAPPPERLTLEIRLVLSTQHAKRLVHVVLQNQPLVRSRVKASAVASVIARPGLPDRSDPSSHSPTTKWAGAGRGRWAPAAQAAQAGDHCCAALRPDPLPGRFVLPTAMMRSASSVGPAACRISPAGAGRTRAAATC